MVQEIKYVPTVIEGLETMEQDCEGFVIQMREKGTTAPVREKIAQASKVGSKWKSEAVVFEETVNGKTYEFRGAVMGKGKLISIFSLWTLFACGITEPTDVSYIGDAIKQTIIWTDTTLSYTGTVSIGSIYVETSTSYATHVMVPYVYDQDHSRLKLACLLNTWEFLVSPYVELSIWTINDEDGTRNVELGSDEKYNTGTDAWLRKELTIDLDLLNLTDNTMYLILIRLRISSTPESAGMLYPIVYVLGN